MKSPIHDKNLLATAVCILVFAACRLTIGADPPKATAPKVGKMAGEERTDNLFQMKLIWCPPGKFRMGGEQRIDAPLLSTEPVDVEISSGFWIGKFEVTQREWTALMNTRPWQSPFLDWLAGEKKIPDGDEYAASFISHDRAVDFCESFTETERLAGRIGSKELFALPTEAQWEYACRAGTTTDYWFGDDDSRLSEFAWWGVENNGNAKGEPYAHRVGRKRANPWGIHDMHGNVSEWCADFFHIELVPGIDPFRSQPSQWRSVRSGSVMFDRALCRSAFRWPYAPGTKGPSTGFRVVFNIAN